MASEITPERLAAMRHTAAHVLAAASLQLRPDTKLGVGPAVADGFYHDIDTHDRYTEADVPRLQKEMEKIKKKNLPVVQRDITKNEARALFANDPYKLELLDELPGDTVGISDMGDGWFVTLCKGGHVATTGEIGHFKLTRISGVYWKSDATRPQLQRIYGFLFATYAELEKHEAMLAEAKQRDHKKLGPALDLFTFSDLVGPGLPLWTPKGTTLRTLLDTYVSELREPYGYQRVEIPHITKKALYEQSGHWEKFKDELFQITTREGHEFAMKPMNCPHHTQLYARRLWSYRELPQRYANTTMCYRDEQTGELAGLARARSFTQDDAHIFCRMSQVKEEFLNTWDIVHQFYSSFGFTLSVRFSRHDPARMENYLGDEARWQEAEKILRDILTEKNIDFIDGPGEAAFYGPKLDFLAHDSLGREWQVATIQLDFTMPERFDLVCVNEEGARERIVMIHAAIMGSLERFLAILIEHYAGNFPTWLSPTQVLILPIADAQVAYARELATQLREANVRVEIDENPVSIGKKIRAGQLSKAPYLVIVGKKEAATAAVAVRSRQAGDEGVVPAAEFTERLQQEIRAKR